MYHPATLATTLLLVLSPAAAAQEPTLYSTDFTTLAGWTVTSACTSGYMWAADATPASHPSGPYVSPPASLNFNNGVHIGGPGIHGGADVTCGSVRSVPIDLAPALGVPHLRFLASWNHERLCEWDVLSMRVLSVTDGAVLLSHPCFDAPSGNVPWTAFEFPLDRSWGEVSIEFAFHTIDDWANDGSGPFIDDLAVVDVLPVSTPFCHGDGSGTACPCSNAGAADAGCANSTGAGAILGTGGTAGVAAGDLVLAASQLRPLQFGTYLQGNNRVNGGSGNVFGDGLRCAGEGLVRLQQVQSSASGESSTSIDLAQKGGVAPGDTRRYQLWYRDPITSPCGTFFNLTNGVEVTWLP